jgi:hypothetical protein
MFQRNVSPPVSRPKIEPCTKPTQAVVFEEHITWQQAEWHDAPKAHAFSKQHGITSQKTAVLIFTVLGISDVIYTALSSEDHTLQIWRYWLWAWSNVNEILKAVNIKTAVFWVVMPCSLVTCCLHLLPWRWRQYCPSKHWQPYINNMGAHPRQL